MILALAMLLDAVFGEPQRLWSRAPHPAILMGGLIGWADRRYNHGLHARRNGAILTAALCLGGWVIGGTIEGVPLFGGMLSLALAAILIAQKSLAQHVRAVAEALDRSTVQGREAVARIVGRDTAAMDEPAIARAAIESAAENFSDAVAAPVFWFAIAGLPGLLIYKAVNTADSMIGYRTPRHEAFGRAAARLDDLLNLVPSRLSALLILAVHTRLDLWRAVRRDAPKHRSPNAGWPETAMAAVLDVALAGPRSYDGQLRDFPFAYPEGRRDPGPAEIRRAVRAIWRAWAGLLAIVCLAALV